VDLGEAPLKEAVEAIDKVADVLKKLGALLSSAIDRGVELMAWRQAKSIRNELSAFLVNSTHHLYRSNATMADLLSDERLSRDELRFHIDFTLLSVTHLLDQLAYFESEIASKEFYALMVEALRARQTILIKMRQFASLAQREGSNSEYEVRWEFHEKYLGLIDQLKQANSLLAKYIEQMELTSQLPKTKKAPKTRVRKQRP
jgi:hypothetical protein